MISSEVALAIMVGAGARIGTFRVGEASKTQSIMRIYVEGVLRRSSEGGTRERKENLINERQRLRVGIGKNVTPGWPTVASLDDWEHRVIVADVLKGPTDGPTKTTHNGDPTRLML